MQALPPIIRDMINKLLDDGTPPHEKNNVASTLEIIGSNCTLSASKWREKFAKNEAATAMRRKKVKVRA